MLNEPSTEAVRRIVQMALDEDAPWGDLTSQTLIPESASINAKLVARETGILSGVELFAAAMKLTDPAIEDLARDGLLVRHQGRGTFTNARTVSQELAPTANAAEFTVPRMRVK